MDVSGQYRVPAPRPRVWQALYDTRVVKACLPGCERLDQGADGEWLATVTTRVGTVKATFHGRLTISEADPPSSYLLSGQGQGGSAGHARGAVRVALVEDDGWTTLSWSGKVDIGGRLASVGSRLLKGVTEKTIEDFFARFSDVVAAHPGEAPPAQAFDAEVRPPPARPLAITPIAPRRVPVEAPPKPPPPPARTDPRLWVLGTGAALWLAVVLVLFVR